MDREANSKLRDMKNEMSDDKTKSPRKSHFLDADRTDEWHQVFHYVPKEIRDLIIMRNEFRLQRLFTKADEIKERIWLAGYGIRDDNGWIYVYRRREEISKESKDLLDKYLK